MVASMTAFARIEMPDLVWEIRSVNHRFLDLSFRMPEIVQRLEPQLRELSKASLQRGKVDSSLQLVQQSGYDNLKINKTRLEELIHTIDEAKQQISAFQTNHIDLMALLRWPGVLDRDNQYTDQFEERICSSFEIALRQLQDNRDREGSALTKIFEDRIDLIKQVIEKIRKHTMHQSEWVRDRLLERVEKLNIELDQTKVAHEVALLAQRADVGEEIDRLRVHITEFENCLCNAGPQGRRLGFLVQEMARESNTLASKNILQESTNLTVDLKVLIDQIREQVQNIE